jgi:hypothetical protein
VISGRAPGARRKVGWIANAGGRGRPSHRRARHCRPRHCRPRHCRPRHCRPRHCRPRHLRLRRGREFTRAGREGAHEPGVTCGSAPIRGGGIGGIGGCAVCASGSRGHVRGTVGQLVTVTAASYRATRAELSAYRRVGGRWRRVFGPWAAWIGRNGLAPPGAKREGDGRTPRRRSGAETATPPPGPGPHRRTRPTAPMEPWAAYNRPRVPSGRSDEAAGAPEWAFFVAFIVVWRRVG